MRITVLTDFEAADVEAAAETLGLIQSVSSDAVVLVESPSDLLLIHELRRFGIRIKGACLGHVEKKLIQASGRAGEVN